MADLDSATPKSCVRTILSSAENFQNFDCHIGSAIFNFENLTPDSNSATPKTYAHLHQYSLETE